MKKLCSLLFLLLSPLSSMAATNLPTGQTMLRWDGTNITAGPYVFATLPTNGTAWADVWTSGNNVFSGSNTIKTLMVGEPVGAFGESYQANIFAARGWTNADWSGQGGGCWMGPSELVLASTYGAGMRFWVGNGASWTQALYLDLNGATISGLLNGYTIANWATNAGAGGTTNQYGMVAGKWTQLETGGGGGGSTYDDTALVLEDMLADYRIAVLEDAASRSALALVRDWYTDTNSVAYNTNAIWSISAPQYQNYSDYTVVPTNGRVAYYKLDGDLLDQISAGSGTWTWTVAYSNTVPAKLSTFEGYAQSADCTPGYISFVNSTLLNGATGCTIAAWVKLDAATAYSCPVFSRGTLRHGLWLIDGVHLYAWVNGDGPQTVTHISTNSWTHLAMTWQSNAAIIVYINGASNIAGTVLNATINQDDVFRTTDDAVPDTRIVDGKLSEVLIYNRRLSAGEVYSLAVATAPTNASITSASCGLGDSITRVRPMLLHETFSGTLGTNLQMSVGASGACTNDVALGLQGASPTAGVNIYTGDVTIASTTSLVYQVRMLGTNVYHRLHATSLWIE